MTGGAFGPEGGLAFTIVMIVGIVVLLVLGRRKSAASEISDLVTKPVPDPLPLDLDKHSAS
jgi:hypothetical protein